MQLTQSADVLGFDPQSTTVVGVAPGGPFEMVRLQYTSIGLGADIVQVRSRLGLCIPEVEITSADGTAWRTT